MQPHEQRTGTLESKSHTEKKQIHFSAKQIYLIGRVEIEDSPKTLAVQKEI